MRKHRTYRCFVFGGNTKHCKQRCSRHSSERKVWRPAGQKHRKTQCFCFFAILIFNFCFLACCKNIVITPTLGRWGAVYHPKTILFHLFFDKSQTSPIISVGGIPLPSTSKCSREQTIIFRWSHHMKIIFYSQDFHETLFSNEFRKQNETNISRVCKSSHASNLVSNKHKRNQANTSDPTTPWAFHSR